MGLIVSNDKSAAWATSGPRGTYLFMVQSLGHGNSTDGIVWSWTLGFRDASTGDTTTARGHVDSHGKSARVLAGVANLLAGTREGMLARGREALFDLPGEVELMLPVAGEFVLDMDLVLLGGDQA